MSTSVQVFFSPFPFFVYLSLPTFGQTFKKGVGPASSCFQPKSHFSRVSAGGGGEGPAPLVRSSPLLSSCRNQTDHPDPLHGIAFTEFSNLRKPSDEVFMKELKAKSGDVGDELHVVHVAVDDTLSRLLLLSSLVQRRGLVAALGCLSLFWGRA